MFLKFFNILLCSVFFVCSLWGQAASGEEDEQISSVFMTNRPGKPGADDLLMPLDVAKNASLLLAPSFCTAEIHGLKKVECSQDAIRYMEVLRSRYQNPLFLFDYDGLIAKGASYPLDRFDKEGVWQPRCSALFAFFTKLRKERPSSVYVFSAGLLFQTECEHYLPELRLPQATKDLNPRLLLGGSIFSPFKRVKNNLFFVEDLGFHVRCEAWADKGRALEGALDFLRERGGFFDAISFVDDMEGCAEGVKSAGEKLGIPTLSICFPYPIAYGA